MTAETEIRIQMLLLPRLTQLDLTGPYEVLARMPGAQIALVAESLAPVASDRGLALLPTTTREQAGPADLLVVPGGPGIDQAIGDPAWVGFVRAQALTARWIFGICTGSLLLGAAGLLRGRRATSHWLAREFLGAFGAIPAEERMVVDANLFTSGGVTAGIDMALRVVAELQGEETARLIQLQIEYDPDPPFRSGSPAVASAETVATLKAALGPYRQTRAAAVAKAAAALESA